MLIQLERLKGVGAFELAISMTLSMCVTVLFMAIAVDFLMYNKEDGRVKREKRSIVDTLTMTLFFLGFYLLIRFRVGEIPADAIGGVAVERVLAIMGSFMVVAGTVMNIIGRFNLGSNWANHVRIYDDHSLVRTGMYRYVRHPLYASIMLMFFGAVLIYRNLAGLVAVCGIFIPFMNYRAKQEEKFLRERFSGYEAYMAQVGRFFPKRGSAIIKEEQEHQKGE